MMSSSRGPQAGDIAIALFAGIAIGTVVGILIAPKSGRDTRKDLIEKGEKIIEQSRENFEGFIEKSKSFAEAGKQKIEEFVMMGEEVIEKGKSKAASTASKIKDIVKESKKAAKDAEDFLS
jgi:gas vesicle protein